MATTASIQDAAKVVFAREATAEELAFYADFPSFQAVRSAMYADPLYQAQSLPVARLYFAVLGRDPEPGGLWFYINEIRDGLMTLESAARGFLNSPEAAARFGYMEADDTAFIQKLYLTCLHREAEPAGLQYYLDQLAAGHTRETVAIWFSLSPENVARVGIQEFPAYDVGHLYDSTGGGGGGSGGGGGGGGEPPGIAPEVDLDTDQSDLNIGRSFHEQTALHIAPNSTISDVDSTSLVSLTVTLMARPDGNGVESLSLDSTAADLAATSSLSVGYNAGSGVLSVSGSASVSVFAAILRGVVYQNSSDTPSTTGRVINVVVSDGSSSSAVRQVLVDINAVNDAPVAADDSLSSVAEDSAMRVISIASLLGNDSAGPSDESAQVLTITSVSNAVGGTAVINGANIEFTPPADFNGTASFDYTVQDNGQTDGANDFKTDVGSASFTITTVNDAPVAFDDLLSSVVEDSAMRIITFASLLGNDSEGPANESAQVLTITALANVVGGTAVINGTNVEFTPGAGFSGVASFDYTVRDNGQTNGVNDFKTDVGKASFTITDSSAPPSDPNDFDDVGDGASGDDTVAGGAGNSNDTLYGGGGNDTVDGLNGNDAIYGGAGNDSMTGGDQDDAMYGGSGNDTMRGGGNEDTLYGGAGNDSLYGEANGDNLIGGWGADTLEGGANADTFVFLSLQDAGDFITDFAHASDKISLSSAAFTGIGSGGALDAGDFTTAASGAGATDTVGASVNLIYDANGALYYDSDGGGSGNRTLLVTLVGGGTLDSTDILVTA